MLLPEEHVRQYYRKLPLSCETSQKPAWLRGLVRTLHATQLAWIAGSSALLQACRVVAIAHGSRGVRHRETLGTRTRTG